MAKKQEKDPKQSKVQDEDEESEGTGSSISSVIFFVAIVAIGAAYYLKKGGGNQGDCGCPKKWDPICIEVEIAYPEDVPAEQLEKLPTKKSHTLPNECMAECHGLGPGIDRWYPGECIYPPSNTAIEKCVYLNCDMSKANQETGLCLNGKSFPNECVLDCVIDNEDEKQKHLWNKDNLEQFKCPDWCGMENDCEEGRECVPDPGGCFDEECLMYKCVKAECACKEDFEYKPVCAKGRSFTNACFADCEGATEWTEGRCETHDQWRGEPFTGGVFPFPDPETAATQKAKMEKDQAEGEQSLKRHQEMVEKHNLGFTPKKRTPPPPQQQQR